MIPHITLHLLDSAGGHPLQSWSFEDCDTVTLGRSPENDVVVADPYVSRAHAYLKFLGGCWNLISLSQHMICCDGRSLRETPLDDGAVFRLGPHGCFLRFSQSSDKHGATATMTFDRALTPIFKLDRDKMQEEVGQIADAPFFEQLKLAVQKRRAQQQLEETKS